MSKNDETIQDVTELAALFRGGAEKPMPTGGFRRLFGTARAAAKTGMSVLSGRLRRTGGDGLAGADVAAIEQLVSSLGRLKGLPMKIGQIMGYIDVTLPPEMRELLSLLQTQSQPSPFDEVEATVRDDLGGRAASLLAGLEREPVSVASIGQVHRGRLPDGTVVAVKVRHPGIEEAISADFRMASVAPVFARMLAPVAGGSVKGFIREAEDRLREECDYRLEAERQQRFGELFADSATIRVPAVLRDWSGDAVLTTAWAPGMGFEAWVGAGPTQAERDRVGHALFDFFVGTLYRSGLFHADPHPGNLALSDGDAITVYDYGCVREFDAETVAGLAALSRAARDDDGEAMIAAMEQVGARPSHKERDVATVRELLRSFYGPMVEPGAHPIDAAVTLEARSVMRSKRQLFRMQLPGKLLFLFRIRFGLYAVLARLGAVQDWRALEEAAAAAAE